MNIEEALLKIISSDLNYPAPLELRRALSVQPLNKRENAAVCILFDGESIKSAKILLTERSSLLPTHAGQVAFPGGVLEVQDQNNLSLTAIRETWEETGIKMSAIQVLGTLPEFPTLSGNFEVLPVLAKLKPDSAKDLILSEEVSVAEWVSLMELFSTRAIETHLLQDVEVKSPYFMWGNRKMWGVSAWIFDLICARYGTIK